MDSVTHYILYLWLFLYIACSASLLVCWFTKYIQVHTAKCISHLGKLVKVEYRDSKYTTPRFSLLS